MSHFRNVLRDHRRALRRCAAPAAVVARSALLALATLFAITTAQAEPPRLDRGPGYAPSTWPTIHGDSRNSDFVPVDTALDRRLAWRALEGAGIWTAPSVAVDGTLFATTGRGPGSAHLHALSPDGKILWESKPQQTLDDLDAGAVTSAPVIDDAGDVYVGDENQFWAFHPDGRVKWVVPIGPPGVRGPFVTALIRGPLVGGISVDGQVVLFERASGQLAANVLELPGGPSPEGDAPPDWLWDGIMDPATKRRSYEILMGARYEVSNSPAVHPSTGRIYVTAGGRTLEEGIFYGIDLIGGELRIGFETPIGPNSGTSPALSPDGTLLFACEGDGTLFAIDAETGVKRYERDVGCVPASPMVDAAGAVYLLATERLVKVDGPTGEIIWERSYPEFALQNLPTVSRLWPFVESGVPVASIDSVVTVTNNVLWTTLALGWQLEVFGTRFIHQRSIFLVGLDPATGDVLASYPTPDTSEGGISVGPKGELYLDLLAVQGSIASGAPYVWLLPRAMRTPQPTGGIVAFVPDAAAQ